MKYCINTIYQAIQGEGCQTGTPMVLVRLQGCTVGCPWCDSKQTWDHGGREVELGDLITEIKDISPTGWVLVTGGEPAEQDLGPLIDALYDEGYKIALETSGTADGCLGASFDWVCVSPKPYKPMLPGMLALADEVKYIVGKPADIEDLDILLDDNQLKPGCQICLQPISQSTKATQLCIDTVQERKWRLSVQVHKYLNLP